MSKTDLDINDLASLDNIYPSDNFWYLQTIRPPFLLSGRVAQNWTKVIIDIKAYANGLTQNDWQNMQLFDLN